MKVLVACEYSGRVRDAFIRAGHFAISCDLLPTESDFGPHYQGDVFELIESGLYDFDLMIAHPPCTYLAVSGLHWNKRNPERAKQTEEALDFVTRLWNLPIERVCVWKILLVVSIVGCHLCQNHNMFSRMISAKTPVRKQVCGFADCRRWFQLNVLRVVL